jgi:hypothetical protein
VTGSITVWLRRGSGISPQQGARRPSVRGFPEAPRARLVARILLFRSETAPGQPGLAKLEIPR